MMKKLTKGIEDSKKEKERLNEEKEKLKGTFKEIEQKAFAVQENYKKTQEVLFIVLLLVLLCKLCA
jgi:structural maintenance of chromosome 4